MNATFGNSVNHVDLRVHAFDHRRISRVVKRQRWSTHICKQFEFIKLLCKERTNQVRSFDLRRIFIADSCATIAAAC